MSSESHLLPATLVRSRVGRSNLTLETPLILAGTHVRLRGLLSFRAHGRLIRDDFPNIKRMNPPHRIIKKNYVSNSYNLNYIRANEIR